MIVIKNLTKYYSRKQPAAISNVNVTVNNGEIVGFVGLNGAGKTTTIRIAAGVTLPTSGTVLIDGKDIVRDKKEASYRVGWVPEVPVFDLNAKALDLMLYFSGYYGINAHTAKTRALSLLEQTDLAEVKHRKLNTYSQGMRKRFSLAVALLPDPPNFLMDEVLNGLDPEGIMFFRKLTLELKKKNKAVLFSSHILSEVETIADRVVIIHKGKIIKTMFREDLENIGKPMIQLKIENIDKSLIEYLESIGTVEKQYNNSLVLADTKISISDLNKELIKRNYKISEIRSVRENLEEYFFEMVGVKK